MSDNPASSTKGATFTFVLGAFAAFAVLLTVIQWWKAGEPVDPRATEREKAAKEISDLQKPLLEKMGLTDKAKTAALFSKTADALKAKAPAATKMPVPPPMTAAPAAAAPVAPAAAPAAPAAPPTAK